MTLDVGKKIPAFKAHTKDGAMGRKDLIGENVVIYFYPRDNTPGCTKESCDFRDNLPRFKRLKTKVYGVSKDSLKSHEKFSSKYELPFTLISDENGNMCEKFETWLEKSMYGRKYMGIERSTFLIDKEGVIRHIWRKVKVKDHVDDVLSELKKIK